MENSESDDHFEHFRHRRATPGTVRPLTAEGLRTFLVTADQNAKRHAALTLGQQLGEVWTAWLDDIHNSTTKRLYRHDTAEFATWCELRRGGTPVLVHEAWPVGHGIARALVFEAAQAEELPQQWKHSMIAGGLSVSVINRRLGALRSLIAFAHDHGLVNWAVKVGNQPITPTTPTAAACTSASDVEQVRAYLHRPTWNATKTQQNRWRRDGALFEVLASTGIRPEEVPRLSVSALGVAGIDRGHLFIPSHSNRGAGVRQVPLSKQSFRVIHHWVELRWPINPTAQADVNEPMFIAISRHGHFTTKALTSDGIRKILKGIAIDAGVEPRALRPHQLQRYACTQPAYQEPTTITETISGQRIEAPHDADD